jgi:uncharacterized membrane protein (DUF2068 family)
MAYSDTRAVRIIAFIEAAKGVLVLLAATGILAFIHADWNELAARLVRLSHLNPASKYPHIFLDAVSHLQEPRLLWLAAGAATYSLLRLVEAYGLYRERAWAEWLALVAGGLFIPAEINEVIRRPSLLTISVLAVNVVIVAVMAHALWQRRRTRVQGREVARAKDP